MYSNLSSDNSTATVLFVDAHANTLTVATRDGNEVSYNPALLRMQTAHSTVYREEQRDLAVGERIRFTDSNREAHVRSGDFGTVERIGEDNALSARLDNGKSVELEADTARHIEYGYAVESIPRTSVDRILITGNATELALQQEEFAHLSPCTRDLALYTSDRREHAPEKAISGVEVAIAADGLSPSVCSIPAPEIEREGLGIGLTVGAR